MDQDDEARADERARDLPGNIWFDLLNFVWLFALSACAIGAWLAPLS